MVDREFLSFVEVVRKGFFRWRSSNCGGSHNSFFPLRYGDSVGSPKGITSEYREGQPMAQKKTELHYEPLYKPSAHRQQEETGKQSTRKVWATLVRRLTHGLPTDRRR
jgi:hypothetical protein